VIRITLFLLKFFINENVLTVDTTFITGQKFPE